MSQQLQGAFFDSRQQDLTLPAVLAGDIAAATISATLISPLITAIDRSVSSSGVYLWMWLTIAQSCG